MDDVLPRSLALRDGRCVTLRAIVPQDKEGFLAAFERLSETTRYARFLAPMRSLSEQTLEAATQPDLAREFALVATAAAPDGEERIVAGARYASARGSDTCEFAVTVSDEWQGAGLARHLMQALMAVARQRGYTHMEGYVLPVNEAMRALAGRLGFEDRTCPDDPTLRLVTIALR